MKRAFTLIELLVVLSIIALLIAILLPALGAARESGRTAICLSNERQMMIANEMYAEDHDELYTDNKWYGNGQVTINGQSVGKYWVIDEDYLEYVGFNDYQISNILSGGNSNQIWGADWPAQFLCPSAPRVENIYNHRISYAFNSQVHGQYEREKVKNADEKYAYVDQQNWLANKGMANYADWDQHGEEWSSNHSSGLKYRHSENINIVFFDGHAETLSKSDTYKPGDNAYNDARWFPEQ